MGVYRDKTSTSTSKKIIKPVKRSINNKNNKTMSSSNLNRNSITKNSSTRNSSSIHSSSRNISSRNISSRNISSRNRKIKDRKKKKIKLSFNKLKVIELIAKLQIGFVIVIILMIIFSKFNVIENILRDELSVFGGERKDANSSSSNSVSSDSNSYDVISSESQDSLVFNQSDNKEILTTSDIEITNNSANNAIISYMKGNSYEEIFRDTYVVDSRAGVTKDMFNFEEFEKQDLTLTTPTDTEPKVLIFHTHGNEQYKDSKDISEGVYLLGETLEKELEEKYGINTIHIEKRYDIVDGQTQILGAYERMEPDVQAVLKKYPSIEVCIDIHRDGLPGDMKQVVDINGEKYAPLMFVNGLSSFNNKGVVEPLTDLENPNLDTNLAFSYRLKQATNTKYNGLFKDIYLNAYRYSLHMKPKSILLEVGAQNNTVDEAVRSTEKFAEILAGVLKGEY